VAPKKFRGENPLFADFRTKNQNLNPNAGKIGKSKTIGSICGYVWSVDVHTKHGGGSHNPTLEIGCSLCVWGGASKFGIDIT